MTDDDRDHEQLRRRLADEGPVPAPPDIAPEVMRRVRSEPRSREHRILRPVATLLAAAVLVIAAVAGISRLGGSGSASSASSGAPANGGGRSSVPSASGTSQDAAKAPGVLIPHVHAARLAPIFAPHRVPPDCPAGDRLSVTVPYAQLPELEQRLRSAAAGAIASANTRDVELHRAPRGQTRIRITCP